MNFPTSFWCTLKNRKHLARQQPKEGRSSQQLAGRTVPLHQLPMPAAQCWLIREGPNDRHLHWLPLVLPHLWLPARQRRDLDFAPCPRLAAFPGLNRPEKERETGASVSNEAEANLDLALHESELLKYIWKGRVLQKARNHTGHWVGNAAVALGWCRGAAALWLTAPPATSFYCCSLSFVEMLCPHPSSPPPRPLVSPQPCKMPCKEQGPCRLLFLVVV